MSYKNIYKQDKEYQNMVNRFKEKKAELERLASFGYYKKDYLLDISKDIFSELSNGMREHHKKLKSELSTDIERLSNRKHKDVGYADRPNEAKEFEMKYKLAPDHEMKNMVQNLNTNDLLEINLLRMELKNRGMDDLEKKVRHYVIQNDIGGMNESERQEYESKKQQFATVNTLGSRGVIIDDEYASLNNIESELFNIAISTKEAN